jgi:hypothetical protein
MSQRIITAAIRRCAFAICKAAIDVVSAADRCTMRLCHLFHARHAFAFAANRSNSNSNKRLIASLRGSLRCLSSDVASSYAMPMQAAAYQSAEGRSMGTRAWRVRPTQVVRGLTPVALG